MLDNIPDDDLVIDKMLSGLSDAGFGPYREGLRDLQIRKAKNRITPKAPSSKANRSIFRGERLLLAGSDQDGLMVNRLSAKLSHPKYIDIQQIIDELRVELNRVRSECIARERRMLLTDSEADAQNYETLVSEMARLTMLMSNVLLYRHITNIEYPRTERSDTYHDIEELTNERAKLIDGIKSKITDASSSTNPKISKDLQTAHHIIEDISKMLRYENDVDTDASMHWPGKIDKIVVKPPRTTRSLNTVRNGRGGRI